MAYSIAVAYDEVEKARRMVAELEAVATSRHFPLSVESSLREAHARLRSACAYLNAARVALCGETVRQEAEVFTLEDLRAALAEMQARVKRAEREADATR